MRTPREAGLKIIADIERVNRAELDLDDLPDSMQELYHLCLGEDGTIDESRMMVEVAALLNCLDYIRDGYYEHPSYLLPRLEAVYGMVAAQRAKEGES